VIFARVKRSCRFVFHLLNEALGGLLFTRSVFVSTPARERMEANSWLEGGVLGCVQFRAHAPSCGSSLLPCWWSGLEDIQELCERWREGWKRRLAPTWSFGTVSLSASRAFPFFLCHELGFLQWSSLFETGELLCQLFFCFLAYMHFRRSSAGGPLESRDSFVVVMSLGGGYVVCLSSHDVTECDGMERRMETTIACDDGPFIPGDLPDG
jgi:hypothetical protein